MDDTIEPDPQELGAYVEKRIGPGVAELQVTHVRGAIIDGAVYINANDVRAKLALVAAIMTDEVAAQADYYQMLGSLGAEVKDTAQLTRVAGLTCEIAALFIKHIPASQERA